MNKPESLYHGSVREIEGNKLLPKQAQDLGEELENLHHAVYATNVKEIAIAMAIISCRGVNGSSLRFRKKPFGTIYKGWPKQEYIYLYTLPSRTFEQEGGSGTQWYSLKPVKPKKVEKIYVKEHIHLIRKATDKERKNFFKKYKDKI